MHGEMRKSKILSELFFGGVISLDYSPKNKYKYSSIFFIQNISSTDLQSPCRVLPRRGQFHELHHGWHRD